ncbi:eukaryotic translation initiation factor 2B [Clavulina sp. PMI_390]|nr:eukaryotic translation initiation factor 2B [Clavulina sp. PMI_390]
MAIKLLTSIRTSDASDEIEIINQLLLPHTTEWVKINSIEDAHDAIKTMKIRGAPAIASLASLAVAQNLSRLLKSADTSSSSLILASQDTVRAYLTPLLDFLYTARPTAVNLGTAIKRLRAVLVTEVDAASTPVTSLVEKLIKEAHAIVDEDFGRNKEMSRHGAEWILEQYAASPERFLEGGKVNVMTLCNTGSLATSGYGTALGVITHLFETEKLGKAFYTQTAPYHQGSRLTSLELLTIGAPSVMICDTMVGSLFQHHNIHAVLVGADRVVKNGDTANKIGTYNAAVLAARHKIPFIVVAPVSTVDLDIPDGSHIPIEHRPPIEACTLRGVPYPPTSAGGPPELINILYTPPNIDLANGVYNPSFDVTPAELISAVVTEKGVAVRKDGETAIDLSAVV